ncbi:hypothetical protein [Halorhabdus sp. BNX81]|uniref:hypothetical protein n=1 Tax=Halorhabdus sp. BNX81 TaxID=2980181 RepID=UPI0023DCFF43|nr:hypothetical protein [Halorhabdus sp. BNX81]WEL22342.1 hypothetical protein HBNXHr_2296 [Halorhabdus sp. BNX81]
MADAPIVQLLTLWFVAAIFLQTESGGSGLFVRMIGLFALLLVYLLPFVILALVLDSIDNER